MKLLPIKIEVQELLSEDTFQTLYEYNLKINYRHQGDVLTILDEKLKEIVKDFDLSAHNQEKRPTP